MAKIKLTLPVIGSGGGSDPLKLDKAGYDGNAAILDGRIIELENASFPDTVLKYGEIVIIDNEIIIAEDTFNWRLDQIDFLNTPAYSVLINEATDGFYRTDLIVGDNTGNYQLVLGTEDTIAAPEPDVPDGMIKLSSIPVFGATIGTPTISPNYDDKYLKRYKFTYKTTQPIFNIEPSEDDYNVIFNNTTNSEIRIYENGHNGGFIKNGAIYPFKSLGIGNVTVINSGIGVIINAPNGLVLNKNQQCYLIKDDYNEWTLVNPRNLQNIDNTSDATKPVSGPQQTALDLKVDKVTGKGLSTEDYTTSEKNKLASITEIFTTALKSSYDGVVTGYTALIATGSRLITTGEITKLTNTSGTNSGDNATNTQYSGLATSKQDALVSGTNIKTLDGDSLLGSGNLLPKTELAYALADETANLTVSTRIKFRMPHAMTLSEVRISLNDAPTISSVIVDVKENGVSIFSTLLSIDANEKTSVTAATPAVISDVNLADDAEITVSTTQIGSGDTGKGLKILFKGRKA